MKKHEHKLRRAKGTMGSNCLQMLTISASYLNMLFSIVANLCTLDRLIVIHVPYVEKNYAVEIKYG